MPLTLYNNNLSPYASRNRLQVRAKGLENEIALTPRPDVEIYRTISPTAKMPALDVGGFVLPESETIAEYIEERFPEPSLHGRDALGRAKVRLFARFVDVYLTPGFNILFAQAGAKERDAKKIEEGLAMLAEGLGYIDHYLGDAAYAAEGRLTLADCALVPALFYANLIPTMFGGKAFLGHGKVQRYYARITSEDAHAKRVAEEMGVALQEWMASQR
ncbi:glutathione S-transferase family protein [Terricaulis sp.]|uniref:glutathione S-transferase family protein n=1 Tax=Terricaulis sp. TaxID=2768686 RepID=UPI003784EE4C